jgi:hypothetical protein
MNTSTETRYVVFIPDDSRPLGRRHVTSYPEDSDGEPGRRKAEEHVAHLHERAKDRAYMGRRWTEAFAVEQVITVIETRL